MKHGTTQSGDDSINATDSEHLLSCFSRYRQEHLECYVHVVRGVLGIQSRNIPHECVYLLDPKAPLALAHSDGDAGQFTSFLFRRASSSLLCSLSVFAATL
jgi:hypothetical protein